MNSWLSTIIFYSFIIKVVCIIFALTRGSNIIMHNGLQQIAVIHQNSLCSLAMRTILNDIMPFMGAMGNIEIVSYSNIDKLSQNAVFLYFVSSQIVTDNIEFFAPHARRCIVLTEGEETTLNGFKQINLLRPEREVIKELLMIQNHAHSAKHINSDNDKTKSEELSQREKEVLELIVKGYINKEIADRLNISTSTVIFHRKNICERIGSKSIGRLTIYAVMNGIVDLREI